MEFCCLSKIILNHLLAAAAGGAGSRARRSWPKQTNASLISVVHAERKTPSYLAAAFQIPLCWLLWVAEVDNEDDERDCNSNRVLLWSAGEGEINKYLTIIVAGRNSIGKYLYPPM